jgi:hypothetical protein
VGPLIGFWCETGRVTAAPEVAALFAMHLDHGRRRAAHLRYELERVVAALADRGVEVLVLKGMDTAYRYFPEPGTRCSSDMDLVVRPDDWAAACDALRGLDLIETNHPSQPRDSTWRPPGSRRLPTLEHLHADAPWTVDLHRSLDRLVFEGLETGLETVAPAASDVWQEYSRPVRVLAQPLLFTYLALHALSHFYSITLMRLIELVLVAQRDFAGHPDRWEAFADLVARTVGPVRVSRADLAERLVPGTIDRRVLAGIAGRTAAIAPAVRGMTPPRRAAAYRRCGSRLGAGWRRPGGAGGAALAGGGRTTAGCSPPHKALAAMAPGAAGATPDRACPRAARLRVRLFRKGAGSSEASWGGKGRGGPRRNGPGPATSTYTPRPPTALARHLGSNSDRRTRS